MTRANTPRLDGLLDKIDFNDSARLSNEVVNSLVNHFSAQNLGSSVVSGDILGDAYEYMIAQFADDAGKKGGEFYTPVKIVVRFFHYSPELNPCEEIWQYLKDRYKNETFKTMNILKSWLYKQVNRMSSDTIKSITHNKAYLEAFNTSYYT